MIPSSHNDDWQGVLHELLLNQVETPWVEFKHNNQKPDEIGEYISALSNSAALHSQPYGYLVWGVDDKTHIPVGTKFNPATTRCGNEELENWLLHLLQPQLHFRFLSFSYEDKAIVVLEVPSATSQPVRFSGKEWIRIGSYKKPLKDHPEHERNLWRIFERNPFEDQIAKFRLDAPDVLKLLNFEVYFKLLDLPIPKTEESLFDRFTSEGLIKRNLSGRFDITNLGAILFAHDLSYFPHLEQKAARLIRYYGQDKTRTIREITGSKGYAVGFENLINRTISELPTAEVINSPIRSQIPLYPILSIRELIANALIHQDFLITGAGPMIEIFSNRIQITNPGIPLIPPDRFIDSDPQSRNPRLARLMFRMNICEQRGSGIDKVVSEIEANHLPSPRFEVRDHFTRAYLFEPKSYAEMTPSERINACYLHACLRSEKNDPMTLTSLRERFGLLPQDSYLIVGLVQDSLSAGVIKNENYLDESLEPRYWPYWA